MIVDQPNGGLKVVCALICNDSGIKLKRSTFACWFVFVHDSGPGPFGVFGNTIFVGAAIDEGCAGDGLVWSIWVFDEEVGGAVAGANSGVEGVDAIDRHVAV